MLLTNDFPKPQHLVLDVCWRHHSSSKQLGCRVQCDNKLQKTNLFRPLFSKRKDQILKIPDILVENETKFLGLTTRKQLYMDRSCNQLSKKIRTRALVTTQMKWLVNLEPAKMVYYAFAESHIRYGVVIWVGTGNLNRFHILQIKAICTLANLDAEQRCKQAYQT